MKLNDEQFTSIKYPSDMYTTTFILAERRDSGNNKYYWILSNLTGNNNDWSAYEIDLVPYVTKDIIGILNKK